MYQAAMVDKIGIIFLVSSFPIGCKLRLNIQALVLQQENLRHTNNMQDLKAFVDCATETKLSSLFPFLSACRGPVSITEQ